MNDKPTRPSRDELLKMTVADLKELMVKEQRALDESNAAIAFNEAAIAVLRDLDGHKE